MMKQLQSQLWKRSLIHPERCRESLRKKGQREEDLKDFPQEVILYDIPEQELNEAFGEENWKSMPDEISGSFVSNRPNGLLKNTS